MKQLTILLCTIFIFSACKKSAENAPVTANSASTTNDAVADAAALIIKFTFNGGPQGWSVTNNAKFEHSLTAGNPGGCISGIGDALNGTWYFSAPPKLLSSIKATNANAVNVLKFDLKAPSTGNEGKPDVIINSSTLTLVLDIPNDPNDKDWTTYQVYLTNQDKWKLGSLDGKLASKFQVKKALATIKELLIKGSFSSSSNQGYLDNVTVSN